MSALVLRNVLAAALGVFVSAGIHAGNFFAFENRGIVRVSDNRALRMILVRLANHAEKTLVFVFAVNRPLRIKNLVSAVFGVRLSEHHQLDVRRVAFQFRKCVDEVINFVIIERKTQLNIGLLQRSSAFRKNVNAAHWLSFSLSKNHFRSHVRSHHAFSHAVVNHGCDFFSLLFAQALIVLHDQLKAGASFHAKHICQAAVADNIGRFGCPGRDCSETGNHHEFLFCGSKNRLFPVSENGLHGFELRSRQGAVRFYKMDEPSVQCDRVRRDTANFLKKSFSTKIRQGSGCV